MTAAGPRRVPRLRTEIADFWHFVWHPTLHHLPPRAAGPGLVADWMPRAPWRRLLAWVAMLWAINLFALGPLAVEVASLGGARHRLDMGNIPWLTAIVWAPLVEEMLFRYGLRRPVQALWVIPLMLWPLLRGPRPFTIAIVAFVLIAAFVFLRRGLLRRSAWRWHWRRRYSAQFPVVFHLSALLFAGMHLGNFYLNQTHFWLMPVLVLPQWVTGLVLGWMRVRRGIGTSIAMHAMFNAGPILLVMALLKWIPQTMS